MAELRKKSEEERKKANGWLNQFRPNYESTVTRIEKYQERKLFNLEIIALVIIGAFLVNALSTSLFDLAVSVTSQVGIERLIIDSMITVGSLLSLVAVFLFFRKQLKKYQPQKPVLTLVVKPDDIKPFLNADRFNDIEKFVDDGNLKDFKQFGDAVFKRLSSLSVYMFGQELIKDPINEYEEKATIPNDTAHTGLVTIAKDYNMSKISRTSVKLTLQIKLTPHVIYTFNEEGDKTASYSFYVTYHLRVLNPEHHDAGKLIEEYYLYRAHELVRYTSYAVNWAFGDIGLEFIAKKKTQSG
jgi:hypothetical protein